MKSREVIKKNLKKNIFWTSSHPISGSEVSGPEHGKQDMYENKWCILIKDKSRSLRFWFVRKVTAKIFISLFFFPSNAALTTEGSPLTVKKSILCSDILATVS